MLLFLMVAGSIAILFVVLFLYALCKVSSNADVQAGYMEEYVDDVEEIEKEE